MGLPQFTCRTQTYWLGCRSQSLPLLAASRCAPPGLATRSPRDPAHRHTDTMDIRRQEPYMYPAPDHMPPVKPCRWRRHSSPQTRMNRFVFLNLPALSLEVHLGLTTSPHTPFPTGSSPFQCTEGHRRFGSRYPVADSGHCTLLLPWKISMHSKHARAPVASSKTPPETGHTVGDIRDPQPIRPIRGKIAFHQVRCGPCTATSNRGTCSLSPTDPLQAQHLHQPGHTLAAHTLSLPLQLRMHPRRPIGSPTSFMNRCDMHFELIVAPLALARLSRLPTVLPARGDTEHSAHHPHSMLGLIHLHEPEDFPGTGPGLPRKLGRGFF